MPSAKARASGGRRTRGRLRRRLAIAAVVVLALPTLLILAFRFVDPPLTPLMVIRLFEGEGIKRTWMPLEAISPHLARAVIAAEDNHFCQHNGFDVVALKEQIAVWQAGERPRGASTITMQTAKNVFLWPDRSWIRKGLETWLTPQLELIWSKQRILEVYLNVAETGPGIYGAEAAARTQFGRSAAALSRRQAALIATALPNPRQRSAARPSAAHRRQAGKIVRRIDQLGPMLDCARPGA